MLQTKMTSFEQTKGEIADSALGKALGMLASWTWAQIVAKLKDVVNRGTLNWSGNNTTYSVPAGYYAGGTLDSRASYNAGMAAGIAAGKESVKNVKTYHESTDGYNFGQQGPISYTMEADGIFFLTVNTVSASRFSYISVLKNNSEAARLISKIGNDIGIIAVLVKKGDIMTIKYNKTGTINLILCTAIQIW